MPRRTAFLSVLVAVSALVSGCPDSGDNDGMSARSTGETALAGTVHVFAAASLHEAFTALGRRFEQDVPDTAVVFNFGPSSGLAAQIGQGAPADVFASASTEIMDQVVHDGDAADPTAFATNTMQIAVPPDNPAGIRAVTDLADRSVKVALCQADVPCGSAARAVFKRAKITVTPVTEEIDVKATLSKVSLGEVDAGVVYVTDVRAAGDSVRAIEIPDDVNFSTTYPIAALTGTESPATAQAFIDYVLSPAGAAVLSGAGFGKP